MFMLEGYQHGITVLTFPLCFCISTSRAVEGRDRPSPALFQQSLDRLSVVQVYLLEKAQHSFTQNCIRFYPTKVAQHLWIRGRKIGLTEIFALSSIFFFFENLDGFFFGKKSFKKKIKKTVFKKKKNINIGRDINWLYNQFFFFK